MIGETLTYVNLWGVILTLCHFSFNGHYILGVYNAYCTFCITCIGRTCKEKSFYRSASGRGGVSIAALCHHATSNVLNQSLSVIIKPNVKSPFRLIKYVYFVANHPLVPSIIVFRSSSGGIRQKRRECTTHCARQRCLPMIYAQWIQDNISVG